MLPSADASGAAARFIAARSPSGAHTAALVPATERQDSAQAALHAIKRMPALPASSIALKQRTLRPGHNAGGDDARTARERGAKPARRNRTRSTFRIASRKRPSMSEIGSL